MKIEIRNAIVEMLSDDATVSALCNTAEQVNEIVMRECRKLF